MLGKISGKDMGLATMYRNLEIYHQKHNNVFDERKYKYKILKLSLKRYEGGMMVDYHNEHEAYHIKFMGYYNIWKSITLGDISDADKIYCKKKSDKYSKKLFNCSYTNTVLEMNKLEVLAEQDGYLLE